MIQHKIEALLREDNSALRQLEHVREHGPEGAFIAAGFVRNRVWDSLYDHAEEYRAADVDVVYYCSEDASPERDYAYEAALKVADSETDWQVRNQARMHKFHGFPPFSSLEDGLMHWAETATSVGVRLDGADVMLFTAPFGFDDLAQHILRITPAMKQMDPEGFDTRLKVKGWLERWPNLTVVR